MFSAVSAAGNFGVVATSAPGGRTLLYEAEGKVNQVRDIIEARGIARMLTAGKNIDR